VKKEINNREEFLMQMYERKNKNKKLSKMHSFLTWKFFSNLTNHNIYQIKNSTLGDVQYNIFVIKHKKSMNSGLPCGVVSHAAKLVTAHGPPMSSAQARYCHY
jgi:hypothetical protein